MTYSTKPTRNMKATMYLTFGMIGLMAATLALTGYLVAKNDAMIVIGNTFAILSLIVLKPGKDKDEYFVGLWNSGANTAILTLILWAIIGPMVAGLIDGLSGLPHNPRFPHEASLAVLCAGFFAGYNWRRYRGAS